MLEDNPFVGTRPFKETDADRFFGRESDSRKLLDRIRYYPITILTGPSGYGKSSLVNCGVVRKLKEDRLKAKSGQQWLPLTVRNWGQVRGDDQKTGNIGAIFAEILEREAREAFARAKLHADGSLVDLAKDDEARFNRVISETRQSDVQQRFGFISLANSLVNEFRGVIFIFDQFEEILRVGPKTVSMVSELIVELSKMPNVKVMISLRNEYFDSLRIIERQAGPLAQSTLHLAAVPFDEAKDAFKQMASARQVELRDDLLDFLKSSKSGEADLFYYQAVLSEIWEALETKPSVIDKLSLAAAFEGFPTEIEGESAFDLAFERALLKLIDRTFQPTPTHDRIKSSRHRAHAIRLVPWLSSGSFKTTQSEDDLFTKAYGEAMQSAEAMEPEEAMSGSFKLENKHLIDSSELRKALMDEYVETLIRLSDGTILKRYLSDQTAAGQAGKPAQSAYWELTHDRLGDPLFKWSREQINTIKDCRSASLSSRGVTPIKVDCHQAVATTSKLKDTEISDKENWVSLNWRGCSVEPVKSNRSGGAFSGRRKFTGIEFRDCDFRGCVFVRAEFDSCRFTRCNLNGAAFLDCKFVKTTFDDIGNRFGNSIGFFGSEFMGKCEFSRCELTQLTIAGLRPAKAEPQLVRIGEEGLLFKGGSVQSSRFSDIDPKSAGPIRFEDDVKTSKNWADETLQPLIDAWALS